jgi:hypothetical protein
MNKISFVLPIKGSLDILRAFNILIPSIEKFFDIDEICDFFIICVNSEYEIIKNYISKFNKNLKLNIIIENEIIRDTNTFLKLSNWKRQQILKLEIAKILKTKLYITLDSDLFLIKKCSINDFFIDSKIIYNISNFNIHTNWWIDSCKILKYNIIEDKCTFDVTPSIIITNVVLELLDFLNINDYTIFLYESNKNWTEYTLYWLYVINNDYEKLYINNNTRNANLYGFAIWNGNTYYDYDIKTIYDKIINENDKYNKNYFSLIQSTNQILSDESKIILFANYLLFN